MAKALVIADRGVVFAQAPPPPILEDCILFNQDPQGACGHAANLGNFVWTGLEFTFPSGFIHHHDWDIGPITLGDLPTLFLQPRTEPDCFDIGTLHIVIDGPDPSDIIYTVCGCIEPGVCVNYYIGGPGDGTPFRIGTIVVGCVNNPPPTPDQWVVSLNGALVVRADFPGCPGEGPWDTPVCGALCTIPGVISLG